MAKLKSTFAQAEGVAHVWVAHNLNCGEQSSAQTNLRQFMNGGKGRTCYFEGTKIFLYGSHYCAGNFVQRTSKSSKAIQLNSDRYSNTTVSKMQDIKSAIKGNDIEVFTVASPSADTFSSFNLTDYLERIGSHVAKQSKARSTYNIVRERNAALTLTAECKAYCKFWKAKLPKLPAIPALPADFAAKQTREKDAQTVRDAARTARYKAMDAARAKDNAERIAKYAAEVSEFNANVETHIQNWLEGGTLDKPTEIYVYGVELPKPIDVPTLLRIRGNVVETSRHAEVSVSDAIKALKLVRTVVASGKDFVPSAPVKLGMYRLNSIDANGLTKIGCHVLTLESINRIAPALDALAVSEASE